MGMTGAGFNTTITLVVERAAVGDDPNRRSVASDPRLSTHAVAVEVGMTAALLERVKRTP
jgi:hypothetical protein